MQTDLKFCEAKAFPVLFYPHLLLHLTEAQFLPGVDSATHQPDGSVRYYGTWHGTPASGKEVSVKFYGTYDFNKDNKIISGDDFYDVGGLMNSLKPTK